MSTILQNADNNDLSQIFSSEDSFDFFSESSSSELRSAYKISHSQLEGYLAYYSNETLEVEVLSAMITDMRTQWWAGGQIKAEHFVDPRHQKIFRVIQILRSQQKQVDESILTQHCELDPLFLDKKNKNPSLQAAAKYIWYISAFSTEKAAQAKAAGQDQVYFQEMVNALADLYRQRVLIRNLINILQRIHLTEKDRDLGEPIANSDQIIDSLSSILSNAQEDSSSIKIQSTLATTADVINDYQYGNYKVFSTGIKALDIALLGGFHAGRTYCIAAPPKMGKTTLAASVFFNQKMNNEYVMYVGLEMSDKEIHCRIMGYFMSVNNDEMLKARIDSETSKSVIAKMKQFQQEQENLQDNALYCDAPGITFSNLQRIMASSVTQHKTNGFFIDHIGLISNDGPTNRNDQQSKYLSDIAAWFARFAKKHNVWVTYMQQINRDDKLYGSDGALQHADMVLKLSTTPVPSTNFSTQKKKGVIAHMERSRYTKQNHIGLTKYPLMQINDNGPYVEDIIASNGLMTLAEEYYVNYGNSGTSEDEPENYGDQTSFVPPKPRGGRKAAISVQPEIPVPYAD